MSAVNHAVWVKPGVRRKQPGTWAYNKAGGFFTITLESRDPVTGMPRMFSVYDDTPDFNGYYREVPA